MYDVTNKQKISRTVAE